MNAAIVYNKSKNGCFISTFSASLMLSQSSMESRLVDGSHILDLEVRPCRIHPGYCKCGWHTGWVLCHHTNLCQESSLVQPPQKWVKNCNCSACRVVLHTHITIQKESFKYYIISVQTYVALLGQMHYALVSNYMVICPFFFLGLGLGQSTRSTDFSTEQEPELPLSLTAPNVFFTAHHVSPLQRQIYWPSLVCIIVLFEFFSTVCQLHQISGRSEGRINTVLLMASEVIVKLRSGNKWINPKPACSLEKCVRASLVSSGFSCYPKHHAFPRGPCLHLHTQSIANCEYFIKNRQERGIHAPFSFYYSFTHCDYLPLISHYRHPLQQVRQRPNKKALLHCSPSARAAPKQYGETKLLLLSNRGSDKTSH